MIKRVISVSLAFALMWTSAFASVIGSEILKEKQYDIADGTKLYENVILSDQSGVGEQKEYYAVYTPNENTTPVVVSGETLFGKMTISEAAGYMEENGLRPMLGINASYYSLETGVAMGHTISDGRVFQKDNESLMGIGFLEDGTAFISPLKINVNISTKRGDVLVDNVNKINLATLSGITLFTPDFGWESKNEREVLSVVLDVLDNELKIGTEFEATVKSKEINTEASPLNDGEMVIEINTGSLYDYHKNLMNALLEGETVKISVSADGNERWADAKEGLASYGETLIEDGKKNTKFSSGAAPRTAVGVKEDGNVIFYAIDGRQKGVSYGLQLKSLATRMEELGCVDAINLDGGGSTMISGVYPGADSISVINSPSDRVERKVSNFIFLKSNLEKTGVLKSIHTSPYMEKYLSGTSVELTSVGVDTGYYKTDLEKVTYKVDGESKIDGNTLTLIGNGEVLITSKSGNVETKSTNFVYDTPDIKVKVNGKAVDTIHLKDGENVELSFEAYNGNSRLIADEELFSAVSDEDIGYIEDGKFYGVAKSTTNGYITVTAAKSEKKIPVTVVGENMFSDTEKHWAKDMISFLADKGVVSGYKTEKTVEFRPSNSITRAEAAVMLAKSLGLDTEKYKNEESSYLDTIPTWAKGSVNALSSLSYISGKQTENGVIFAPNDLITREELASIIARTLKDKGEETEIGFLDSEEISAWALPHIKRLVNLGIISGSLENTVMPKKEVSRAETAVMLYKLMNLENSH